MNYIFLGAGAIGSFYGAVLSKKHDILLVGRKSHVDAVNKNRILMSGIIKGTFTVKAAEKIDKIKEETVVFLTTKVTDSKNALQSIKSKLQKDTIIVCLQNGHNIEKIAKKIVDCMVLRAVTNQGVIFAKPAKIHVTFDSYLKLEDSPISKKIINDFVSCGIKAEISEDINKDVWRKMLINCIINPLTAILNVPNDEVRNLPFVMDTILAEIKLVLDKEGIIFSEQEYFDARTRNFSKNRSSMFQDINKGKKTEIDYLNGAVVGLAKKHNIKTPVNESLVEMIKFLEQKNSNHKK